MTITINTQNEEDHQALVTFLSANGYDYQIDDQVTQSPDDQAPPIILRDGNDGASNDPDLDNRGPMKVF
ncbi:hypothetical protein EWM62_11155 [Mucilaginibacter terrigena]|uniref:Uncharacterized protein n=1 Tax=Mucilaginibacter terrigena TaxID=2492395 RepID=A0A4Q5LM95_9SPHI|nr:hypothetical protein [Mucilaginibacter terrigena]RYU90092.1 hypothetical protein EWM62_11155 [Mucilaginibacter terrigena]